MVAMRQTCSLAVRLGPGLEFVISDEAKPCWHCETPTRLIEICFEAYLCSEECVRAKDAEYWQALRHGDFLHWAREHPL